MVIKPISPVPASLLLSKAAAPKRLSNCSRSKDVQFSRPTNFSANFLYWLLPLSPSPTIIKALLYFLASIFEITTPRHSSNRFWTSLLFMESVFTKLSYIGVGSSLSSQSQGIRIVERYSGLCGINSIVSKFKIPFWKFIIFGFAFKSSLLTKCKSVIRSWKTSFIIDIFFNFSLYCSIGALI